MSEYSTWDIDANEFVTVYDLEKCLQAIRVRNKNNENLIERLQKKNKELAEEYSKDKEIQKMQAILDNMQADYRRGFPISEEEQKSIDNWIDEHDRTVHRLDDLNKKLKAGGCCGGRYSYHSVPTSIGTSGTVKCHCGAEFEFHELG